MIFKLIAMHLGDIKYSIKYRLRKYNNLYKFLRRVYYFRKFPLPQYGSMIKLLENFSVDNNNVFFIQIGVNNGMDEFGGLRRKYGWSGILIEPQKIIFDQLRKDNNDQKNIFFENIAISDKSDVKKFYRLPFDKGWCTTFASFDKNHVMKQEVWIRKMATYDEVEVPENLNDFIVEEDVVCLTLTDLIKKYEIRKIDILFMDVEGYDYEIIKTIDFNFIKPRILVFEYTHLNRKSYRKCINLLKRTGYKLFSDEMDIIAIQRWV